MDNDLENKSQELINLIMGFTIEKEMSLSELHDCIDKVEQVYYTDALVIRNKIKNK